MTSTQPFTSSSPGALKSVLAAITSFSPSSSTSPCSGDSPVEGEKHTQFCAISPYDCDTDSPSCYDSDSLLDFTGSSQLESVDTLDTSVSWYCRGDSAEDEDEAMLVTRSGDRTPLSPNNYLDFPPPLLDSKVFILHPVKLTDDDFDFTCAGLGEEEEEVGNQVDQSRSVFASQQVQHRHHHHHHHQRRHNTVNHNHNHNHNHNPRPHLHPHHAHKQPHAVAQRQSTTSPLQFSTVDCAKRRWSAPISTAFADMLAIAGFTALTGTSKTPVLSANPTSSDDDRDSDSNVDASSDIQARDEARGRASNKKELQLYPNDTSDLKQDLLTTAPLQIPDKRRESTLSTPRTWPRSRNSKAVHLTLELWNGTDFTTTNLTDDDDVFHTFGDKAVRERSMTMGSSSFPSNKWGNQPPNGYI